MKEPIRILHLSDLHYRSQYDVNGSDYMRMLSRMQDPLAKACAVIRHVDADAIILTGDITDNGTADDYCHVKTVLSEAAGGSVILPVLGNHDRKECFYKGWLGKDGGSQYHWIADLKGYSFIGIDNAVFGKEDGHLTESELQWLEKMLQKIPNAIVCMHHPLNGRAGIPPLPERNELLRVLLRHHVRLTLCGHTHWSSLDSIEGLTCSVAPSLSFRGENTDAGVVFYDTAGYKVYEIDTQKISLIQDVSQQGANIGILVTKDIIDLPEETEQKDPEQITASRS